MKKFYALVVFSLLQISLFSQNVGDFALIGRWDTDDNWYQWDGNEWASYGTALTTVSSSQTVYVVIDALIRTTIVNNGTIYVTDDFGFQGSDVTLDIGVSLFSNGYLTNNGTLEIKNNGVLDLNKGNVTIGSGGQLTCNGIINQSSGTIIVNSDATGTGSLIYDGSVSGEFNQYISSGQWHLLSPVFNDVLSGDFWNGSDDAFLRPYNSPGGGWGSYITALDQTLNVTEGYEFWSTVSGGFTYSESGTFITGSQTLSISTGGSGDEADWNLVGNPYPCGLDWGTVSSRTNCDGSAFYVYNGSSYLANNGLIGVGIGLVGDASSGIIPAMQGFFVKSLGTGNVSIDNTNKAHPDVNFYKSSEKSYPNEVSNLIRLVGSFEDQAFSNVFYRQEGATNGADDIYDVEMLFNNDPNFLEFYNFAGEKTSIINIYNEYPYSIPLGVNIPEQGGDFTISLTEMANIDETFSVSLEDLETSDIIDLTQQDYTVNFAAGGSYTDRFLLHLNSTAGIEDEELANMNIYAHLNKIYINDLDLNTYSVFIYSITGQLIHEAHNLSGNEVISIDQPTGNYVVKAFNEQGSTIKKVNVIHQ